MKLLHFILLLVLSINVSWSYTYDASLNTSNYKIIDFELKNQQYDDTSNLCNRCISSHNKNLQEKARDGSFFAFIGFSNAPKGVSNSVPSTVARVIPGNGPFPTLGLPGSKDVFVTAVDDITGLSAKQLSKRLTIDPSDTFTVIKFPTPSSGIASPVNRLDKGFIGGGRTAGGEREFVIPNQKVPSGAITEVIK